MHRFGELYDGNHNYVSHNYGNHNYVSHSLVSLFSDTVRLKYLFSLKTCRLFRLYFLLL